MRINRTVTLTAVIGAGLLATSVVGVVRASSTTKRIAAPHSAVVKKNSPGRTTVVPSATTAASALIQTIAVTCHTTPGSLQAALRAGHMSPLSICQKTNPAVTEQSLARVA